MQLQALDGRMHDLLILTNELDQQAKSFANLCQVCSAFISMQSFLGNDHWISSVSFSKLDESEYVSAPPG